MTIENLNPFVATHTVVASAAIDTQLLAANVDRRRGWIHNNSTNTLYVGFEVGVSNANFSRALGRDEWMELPEGYTGIVRGIWSAAAGDAQITEFTKVGPYGREY